MVDIDIVNTSFPRSAFRNAGALRDEFPRRAWERYENPEAFLKQAQQDVTHRYHDYKQLSELDWNENTSVSAVKAHIKVEANHD